MGKLYSDVVRPLSIIFETSQWSGEIPEDLKETNVTPIFKRQAAQFHLHPWENNIRKSPEIISQHIIGKKVIAKRMDLWKQHHAQTDLIAYPMGSLPWVKAVYLDVSKIFNTVSYKILVDESIKYGLDKERVRWTENWLELSSSENCHLVAWNIVGANTLVVYSRVWYLSNVFIKGLDDG